MNQATLGRPACAAISQVNVLPYPGCEPHDAMHALLLRLANSDASLLNHPVADIAHEAKALLATLNLKASDAARPLPSSTFEVA